MKRKFVQPKVVHVHKNPNDQRCPVRLFEKYIGLLHTTMKCNALYLRPKVRVTPKCWYTDLPVGINYIRPSVN